VSQGFARGGFGGAELAGQLGQGLRIALGQDARGVREHGAERGGIVLVQARGQAGPRARFGAEVIGVQRGGVQRRLAPAAGLGGGFGLRVQSAQPFRLGGQWC
jgi:hypothetical protein